MKNEEEQKEWDEVHRLLARVQTQYPSLTLDEMHEMFDEVYERLTPVIE